MTDSTTKVSGGIKKPSDFIITVSGKNPSPKSGSSSGTSVTLNAGKYKVTGSGPSGYTTRYCSGIDIFIVGIVATF